MEKDTKGASKTDEDMDRARQRWQTVLGTEAASKMEECTDWVPANDTTISPTQENSNMDSSMALDLLIFQKEELITGTGKEGNNTAEGL